MKYLRQLLIKIWPWYRHRVLYVIADPRDNSITFSKALYHHIDPLSLGEAKVFMFKLSGHALPRYAFCLNPGLEQETQLADIQFNAKHKSIGFEALCPTVNRMLYDYGLSYDKPVKLSIEIGHTTTETKQMTYYHITAPCQ